MWFKREKENTTSKSSSDDLMEVYKQNKKEISHMKSQYQDFILRSLELDFDTYKENLEQKWPKFESPNSEFWNFTGEGSWNEFKLKKTNEREHIRVDIECSLGYDMVFELKKISAAVGYDWVTLDIDKFKDIIYRYYMCIQLKKIVKEREETKANFQKLVNVLGKDTKRDALIDKILNDNG
jgi:hypothetical protein